MNEYTISNMTVEEAKSLLDTEGTFFTYVHLSATNEVLYVGQTNDIERRTTQHKESSPWFADVAHVRHTKHSTRREALALEAELIALLSPANNVSLGYDEDLHLFLDLWNKEGRTAQLIAGAQFARSGWTEITEKYSAFAIAELVNEYLDSRPSWFDWKQATGCIIFDFPRWISSGMPSEKKGLNR
ncbi:GIY-YIG nuclease family protein [Nocardioides sp. NBC_00368]|uniref:GIY-YIG nuclease family protein n=1 Tax=Nocardioides sp. NBC_00368 TaxID=2976000 RepID=UPI002E1E1643